MSADTDVLGELARRFVARAAKDRTRLAELRERMVEGLDGQSEMHHLVHRLAGTAGMFGFDSVSVQAHRVDAAIGAGCWADAALRQQLCDLESALASILSVDQS